MSETNLTEPYSCSKSNPACYLLYNPGLGLLLEDLIPAAQAYSGQSHQCVEPIHNLCLESPGMRWREVGLSQKWAQLPKRDEGSSNASDQISKVSIASLFDQCIYLSFKGGLSWTHGLVFKNNYPRSSLRRSDGGQSTSPSLSQSAPMDLSGMETH